MAVSTFVGSFTTNATTGNQSITGLGFQPKAVIFWATYTAVVGGNNEMRSTFGCATSSTARWCVTSYHNQAGTTSGCEFQSDRCFRVTNGADDATVASASFVSLDADGFTFNMSVAAAQITVNYMALGGTSVSAHAGTFDIPQAHDGPLTITGVPFNPKAAIIGFGPMTDTDNPISDAMMGVGWGISLTESASSNYYGSVSSASGTNTATQIQSVGYAMTRLDIQQNQNLNATYQNTTAGFILDIFHASIANVRCGYLALGGSAGYSSFRFNEPPAIGSRTYTVGVAPKGLLLMSNGINATNGISTVMRRSIGAASISTVTTGGDTDVPPTSRVFYETWTTPLTSFGTGVDARNYTAVQTTGGVNNGPCLRCTYVGSDIGSERILYEHTIPTAQTYSLWFDVLFEEGFDFANGGKMHGLYPTNDVTGGNTVDPDAWSARVMWRANGRLQTYVYHQDMSGTFGTVQRNDTFYLQRERWYAFTAIVKVNDFGLSNGFMQIWVDGVLLIDHRNIRYRAVDTSASLITKAAFSTFHGGSAASYAPRDAAGNITNVYARYDNFSVTAGEHVKPPIGTATPTTTTAILRRVDGMYNTAGANVATMPVTYRSSLNCMATCGATQQTSAATADLTAVGADNFTLNWTKISTRESEVVAFVIGDSTAITVSAVGIGSTGRVGTTTQQGKASTTVTGVSATTAIGTATAVGLAGSIGVQVVVSLAGLTGSVGDTTQLGKVSIGSDTGLVGLEAVGEVGQAVHSEILNNTFIPSNPMYMFAPTNPIVTTSRFGLAGDWNAADGLPTDQQNQSMWLSKRS